MPKLFNFHVNSPSHTDEIIDSTFAYIQHQHPQYIADLEFQISTNYNPHADVNVYLDYMTDEDKNLDHYDMIIYSNGGEPLRVSTELISRQVQRSHNTFLLTNSYLHIDHPMYANVIWYPQSFVRHRDLWTRPFFPFYHEVCNHRVNNKKTKPMIYINGRNDSWRNHFSVLLNASCPEIPQNKKVNIDIVETRDSFFESAEDSKFREYVNTTYDIQRRQPDLDFMTKYQAGINGKFGQWVGASSVMPEYFQYYCVIFPETSGENDELAITEKILKCFFAGCIPWPVGGSNINRLYNQLGFYTAWNLLPLELQDYDHEKNHFIRYKKLVDAIKWMNNNIEVLTSDRALELIESNRRNFLVDTVNYQSAQQFNSLLRKLLS